MIKLVDKMQIIQKHLAGQSNRQIAKEVGLNRKTVDKYVSEYESAQRLLLGSDGANEDAARAAAEQIIAAPTYKTRKTSSRKWNEDMDAFLDEILAAEEQKRSILRTNKQQLTKDQIHKIMRQRGFDIGYTTVCGKVNEKLDRPKEAFIAQKYGFGERFEYDFGEAHLLIAGKLARMFIAAMCAPASGYRFALLYESQKQDVFLDSQVRFFEHMGGSFATGVYDNMRNVVSKFIGKNEKEISPALLALAAYYGFTVNVTNCFAGNEKGSVENAVKVIRQQAFATKWSFASLDEAQKHLDVVLAELNADKDLAAERAALIPHRPAYEVADIRAGVKVDKYSCVQIDKVSYSVPDYLVGKRVLVKSYPTEIVVMVGNEVVARHGRSKHSGDMVLDISHYLTTFKRKPGALARSVALAQSEQLKEIFESDYRSAPREFVAILESCKDADECELFAALRARTHHESESKESSSTDRIAAAALSQIAAIPMPGRSVA